jgi:hypothetical protein
MVREKAQAVDAVRPKVPMDKLGADCPIVVRKRSNVRGAKGAGYSRVLGQRGNRRSLIVPEGDSLQRVARAV